jgi:hypothetical protein
MSDNEEPEMYNLDCAAALKVTRIREYNVTITEQMSGRLTAIKQSANFAQQISNYQRLIEAME